MIMCRVCRRELLEECFFPSSLKKNDYICKECTKKRFEKYRSENPERIKEIAKRTRDKHKDEKKPKTIQSTLQPEKRPMKRERKNGKKTTVLEEKLLTKNIKANVQNVAKIDCT